MERVERGQVGQRRGRELRDGEDEDEIEEQLDVGDGRALVAVAEQASAGLRLLGIGVSSELLDSEVWTRRAASKGAVTSKGAGVTTGSMLERDMLDLTPETEALARNIADERRLSVDEAVREALEARKRTLPVASKRDMSPEAIEARRIRIRQIVAEVAALPILDNRPVSEIIDDINAL